jgi:uncharacterized membrane protein (DUF4010 family)
MVAMGLASVAAVGFLYMRHRRAQAAGSDQSKHAPADIAITTPFSLTQAVKFGLLYAAILLLVKIIANLQLREGLYLVAALAGLTDVDAITLSISQYARDGGAVQIATISIIIASLSNTFVKAAMSAFIGGADYRRPIVVATALIGAAGLGAIVYELMLA